MAATTCYDVLLQLEETQSLGRRTVSTPCGLRASGHRTGRRRGGRPGSEVAEDVADLSPHQAPAETPTSTSAGAAEQAEDVATIRRRPKPGPGRGPNSDRNFGSGLRASADWLALGRLRPLMCTVFQSIQLPSCTMLTMASAIPHTRGLVGDSLL